MITSAQELIAKVLIVNSANEVLVLKLGVHRTNFKNSYKPDLPGGIADPNESGDDAVIRETKEETGIKLSNQDLRLIYKRTKFHADENKSVTKLLYVSHVASTPTIKLSDEHESFRWVSIDVLKSNNDFHGFYREAINHAIENRLV